MWDFDTIVLSEALKLSPSAQVLRWIGARPAEELFTTAISQAEILYGLELPPDGRRRRALQEAIGQISSEGFRGRLLPFDSNAAAMFAKIAATRLGLGARSGRRMRRSPLSQGHTVRRWRRLTQPDFADRGIQVADPWGKP